MRILHVIRTLDPRSGGPSNVIRCMVREQVRLGYQVSVLATTVQAAEPWEPRETYVEKMGADRDLAGAEVYQGVAYGRRGLWANYAFSRDCSRWLRRRLSNHQKAPDVVHIHGTFTQMLSVAAARARRRSIPYVLRPAGSLDSKCFQMGHHGLKKIFTRLVLRKDLRGTACVQATSQPEAEGLSRWVPSQRIRVIPHGADVPSFDVAEASRSFRARFPQIGGKRVILFISRITVKKRPELIVEAMARLRREYQDLALLLAGNDDGQAAVVRAAAQRHGLKDSVVHAGFLQGELKRGAFAVAELFTLPSIEENFGVAVIEAMAHGVPVLVTPGVASHEYVDQSGGGITVEGTAEAFADGIRELLDGDRKAIGQKGRQFVERNLSWPSIVKQLDDLYQDVLA